MSLLSLPRLGAIAAAILVPATLLHAAVPPPAEAPQQASLTGQLLIAAPTMGDPRFQHTVILMVRHDRNGALGIVINRPIGERPLAGILEEIGFVVHSAEYRRSDTVDIDGRVAMTSSLEILRDIGNHRGPSKSLIAFGYAGWAPGQLEGELAHGFWFTTPQDAKLIFDEDRDEVWDNAMKRRTQDL